MRDGGVCKRESSLTGPLTKTYFDTFNYKEIKSNARSDEHRKRLNDGKKKLYNIIK